MHFHHSKEVRIGAPYNITLLQQQQFLFALLAGRFIIFTQSFSNDGDKHLFLSPCKVWWGEALYDTCLSGNNLEGVRC